MAALWAYTFLRRCDHTPLLPHVCHLHDFLTPDPRGSTQWSTDEVPRGNRLYVVVRTAMIIEH